MAIIKIPYKYKEYRDCPKATKVDKALHNPVTLAFSSVALCFLFVGIFAFFYNLVDNDGILNTITEAIAMVFCISSFIILFAGPFLIPKLADKLQISERIYEKETGRKIR